MDKTQAWNILFQATSELRLTLKDHQMVQQALAILKPEEEKVIK